MRLRGVVHEPLRGVVHETVHHARLSELALPMNMCAPYVHMHVLPAHRSSRSPVSAQVTGFVFLEDLVDRYVPPPALAAFLSADHPKPIYIGFGSLVLRDPVKTTELIYEAARVSGRRVLLSRGWAGLGDGVANRPDNVHIVGNCPHGWLFPQCAGVVHHGGAGTTAAGLLAGLPTFVVRSPSRRRLCLPQMPSSPFAGCSAPVHQGYEVDMRR